MITNKEQKRRKPWYSCSSSQQHMPQQNDAKDEIEPPHPEKWGLFSWMISWWIYKITNSIEKYLDDWKYQTALPFFALFLAFPGTMPSSSAPTFRFPLIVESWI